jgi:signal transduction histidine kinase
LLEGELVRKRGRWRFSVYESIPGKGNTAPPRILDVVSEKVATFHFNLDFSPRWHATLLIEYAGSLNLDSPRYLKLQRRVGKLRQDLLPTLLELELRGLETRFQAQSMANHNLRRHNGKLSREIYCGGAIHSIFVKARDETDFIKRVFENTLPLINAKFGVIHLPQTETHLALMMGDSSSQMILDQWLQNYLRQWTFRVNPRSDMKPVLCRPIYDPQLIAYLRSRKELKNIQFFAEYTIHCRQELSGLGVLAFTDKGSLISGIRSFMSVMALTGPYLENHNLRRDFEKQVKLQSQEIFEIERRYSLIGEGRKDPFQKDQEGSSPFADRIFQEVERSRSMALLGELAFGVAHQIRNPLNNMVAALHLINHEDTPEDEKKVLFEALTERVDTLNRMISEFIRYTRIPELNITPESINQVLENTLAKFNAWMEMSNVLAIVDFDLNLPTSQLDLYLMDQAFHNIIKNAIEAMTSGGRLKVSTRKLQVNHGPKPQSEYIKISVQDSGAGIDPKDIEKVLQPFYSRKGDGLGLGMAIVDHVLRTHGGSVRIKSQPGEGTKVSLYLPIR